MGIQPDASFRDHGEIRAPGIFALLLNFFALPAVFAVTGAAMLGLTALSKRVHPRLGRATARPSRALPSAGDTA